MGLGGCGADPILRKRPSSNGATADFPGVDDSFSKSVGTGKKITKAMVSAHNKPSDAWVVVGSKVYDISEFATSHPGGAVILTYAGEDATDVFAAFHKSTTRALLPALCIGDYIQEEPTAQLIQDFRDLRTSMLRNRMFESNKAYYVFKFVSTLSLLAASLAILAFLPGGGLWPVVVSGCLLGLFWQQTGWLAHDFLHHQVLQSRWLNTAIGGYLMGNILQGFSNGWWKSKHNTHHATPNKCDESSHAVDPDIDTLPFLAWSEEMATSAEGRSARWMLKRQAYLFLPILMFARMSWLHSSWCYAFSSQPPANTRFLERSLLVVHYTLFLSAAVCLSPSLPAALLWLFAAQITGGLLLGLVFVQSHNGMEVYSEAKDFYSAQIVSTRDVTGGLFNDWFTGGLNRQIEHHLFPSMPRHNLGKVASHVRSLCLKHGLVYEDVGIPKGTWLVLQRLAEVAAVA